MTPFAPSPQQHQKIFVHIEEIIHDKKNSILKLHQRLKNEAEQFVLPKFWQNICLHRQLHYWVRPTKTRENLNFVKNLAEKNVRPHLSNSDATLADFRFKQNVLIYLKSTLRGRAQARLQDGSARWLIHDNLYKL